MLTYREIVTELKKAGVTGRTPVIAHAAFSKIGAGKGGPELVLGAILATAGGLMMPAFTYTTMITPETGPENNGITYGSEHDNNRMAQFYSSDLPAHRMMGILPETLRKMPQARRSNHPILSFTGVNVNDALLAQTLKEPLGPIRVLLQQDARVLLIGVNHTANTSMHYAERLAGRQQFTRWALTVQGIVECPGFPGCSDGFETAAPALESLTQHIQIGNAAARVLPLAHLVEVVTELVRIDPRALLCARSHCERCDAVRKSLN